MVLPSNQRVKRAMVDYARRHKPPIKVGPGLNAGNDKWGPAARTLAWRISHRTKKIKTTTRKTAELCAFLGVFSLAEKVANAALREVGVKEQPPNSNYGPRVSQYQAVTGAYHQPWCASFASWCYRTAGYKGKLAPVPAWVPSWTLAIRGGLGWKQVPFANARAGDLVTLWGSQHIEVVIRREGDYLRCVGGNTSPKGQNANGGMVADTRRHRSEVVVIGRPK